MTWSAPRSRRAAAFSGPRATATTVAPITLLTCSSFGSAIYMLHTSLLSGQKKVRRQHAQGRV